MAFLSCYISFSTSDRLFIFSDWIANKFNLLKFLSKFELPLWCNCNQMDIKSGYFHKIWLEYYCLGKNLVSESFCSKFTWCQSPWCQLQNLKILLKPENMKTLSEAKLRYHFPKNVKFHFWFVFWAILRYNHFHIHLIAIMP